MSHEKAVITYLGQDPKAGHIVIDVGSAIGTSFLLDAFQHPQLPFMRPPGAIEDDGELLTSTGDHPVMSIRTVLRNRKTGAANSLFKILDVRRAVSIFTRKNAAGHFQHLTHVGWNLTYSIEFGILDGDLTVRHNLIDFPSGRGSAGCPYQCELQGHRRSAGSTQAATRERGGEGRVDINIYAREPGAPRFGWPSARSAE
jgi:hypothetical protein